jgi:hypothetical protein
MKRFFSLLLVSNLFWVTSVSAAPAMIFSVNQDLPMGVDEELIRKNYHVNLGSKQGLRKGTVLDVFRIVSVFNPYDSGKRVNHRVRMGQVKVLHVSEGAAITAFHRMEKETPVMELDQFIVGDHVGVNVD